MGFNPADWANDAIITISGGLISDTVYDYPLNIILSSGTGINGRDTANVFAELGSNSKKIAFTTTVTGAETELYTEVEYWDSTTKEASLWVRVPTIVSGSDTELKFYYDPAHADNNYVNPNISFLLNDSFIDASSSGVVMTRNNNVTLRDVKPIDTTITNHGMYIGGDNTKYLTMTNSSDFDFGSNAFCVEFWVWPYSTSNWQHVCGQINSSNVGWYIGLNTGDAGPYFGTDNNTTVHYSSENCVLHEWNHVAVTYDTTNIRIFVNGKEGLEASLSSVQSNTTDAMLVGRSLQSSSYPLLGAISGFVVHKGAAIYTEEFKPPRHISDLTNDTNTKLFLDFTDVSQGETPSTVVDSSASSHTVTNNGSNAEGTTHFSHRVIECDGTSQYVSAEGGGHFNLGTGDFTIEYWEYRQTNAGVESAMSYDDGDTMIFGYGGTGFYAGDGVSWTLASNKSMGTLHLNEWVHRSVTRSGTSWWIHENGVEKNNWTAAGAVGYNSGWTFEFGKYKANYFDGFLSDIQITKGVAKYTTAFTPPSTPEPVGFVGDTGTAPATRVWDNHYTGVWHMAQDPSGSAPQILDSTGYANHGTSDGTMTSDDLVVISGSTSIDFDGINDFINCGNHISLNPTSDCTFEYRNKRNDQTNAEDWVIARDDNSLGRSYAFGEDNDDLVAHINGAATIRDKAGTNYDWSVFRTVAFVGNSAGGSQGWKGYVDGSASGDNATWAAPNSTTGNTTIGERTYSGAEGRRARNISEVRVTNGIYRSDAWIEATNYSLTNSFIDFGTLALVPVYTHYFEGYTKVKNVPLAAELYLHRRDTGALMSSTTSTGTTGYYYMTTTLSGSHYIVCLDPDGGDSYNDLVIGNVWPDTSVEYV